MKLTFKGNYLKNHLIITIGNESKILFRNHVVEFELKDNVHYDILIEPYDEKNKVKLLFDMIFKMPNLKGYLFWFEVIDAIKVKALLEYNDDKNNTIIVDYVESCYRLETEKWYLPILKLDCTNKITYTYYCSKEALNKGYMQYYLFFVFAFHCIFLLSVIAVLQSNLISFHKYLCVFIFAIIFIVIIISIYYFLKKDMNKRKEDVIRQIKDI